MMDLNYMGVVHAARAVLPGMLKRNEGHLVSVASTLSLMGGWGCGLGVGFLAGRCIPTTCRGPGVGMWWGGMHLVSVRVNAIAHGWVGL